jgi:adenylosuccinate lyase
MNHLTALSPLDGRYASKLEHLRPLFSEYGLIHARILVEIEWLKLLSQCAEIPEVPPLQTDEVKFLDKIVAEFTPEKALRVKEIEKTTNHDVKAVEYYLKECVAHHPTLKKIDEFFHFACTSEDINNVAYSIILRDFKNHHLIPSLEKITETLRSMAHQYAGLAMLSRTHGQAATPTTIGKECANVVARLQRQIDQLKNLPILAKMNGAVGNYNAHHAAYPYVNWPEQVNQLLTKLQLTPNLYTTQIEPHDTLAEWCHTVMRCNTILIDFNRDVWGYISIGYFSQKAVEFEVGSSTMPHKINPIDFENAEGNCGIANALLDHFSQKCPISRWQRDLSDSTVLRNLGVAFGHAMLAYDSTLKGLSKLTVNEVRIAEDLNQNWEVLAEAIQTVMRRYGLPQPYEKLKALTRGQKLTHEILIHFIEHLGLPENVANDLKKLTPHHYLGFAIELAKEI